MPDMLTTPRAASRAVPAVSTMSLAVMRPATVIPASGIWTGGGSSPRRVIASNPAIRRAMPLADMTAFTDFWEFSHSDAGLSGRSIRHNPPG